MDFSSRSAQSQPVAHSAHPAPAAGPTNVNKRAGGAADNSNWERILNLIMAVAIVVLLLATIVGFATRNSGNEASYVDKNKLQAVFLNTGQVYFGKIKTLNNQYVVLSNIYYLQTSTTGTTQQNASTSVSLVKLGCELHEPYDKMVINRSQVTFWENLQDGGQVAKAVAKFQKDNPNGQKCADQSTSSGATTNNVQNAPTSTNPAQNQTQPTTKP